MQSDSAYSSSNISKESGSEESYNRSPNRENGKYMVRKRNLGQASIESSVPKSSTLSKVNSPMMVLDRPVLPSSSLNMGADYWSGSGATHAAPDVPQGMSGAPPLVGSLGFGSDGVSGDLWSQDDREVKRQKRKQANRESARKSRMRKQAEFDELAGKVEALTAENSTLKLEVNRLSDLSKKLFSENSGLLERIRKAQEVPQRSSN